MGGPGYVPTTEEIRQRCLEIHQEWSEYERQKRIVDDRDSRQSQRWRPPAVRYSADVGSAGMRA